MNFVIVGGGIYGCTVAWELAGRGAGVTLLEARQIAAGASGGLGKRGVRANGRDLRELPLMRLAYDRWPTMHEAIDAATGYERCGHLLLFERTREMLQAPVIAQVQTAQGIPTRLVSAAELYEMEPWLAEDMLGALYCPLDGVADHTSTTQGMARAATRLGAEIREHVSVARLEVSHGRVTAVITGNDEVILVPGKLLLLSNAHVPVLLRELGFSLPIWTILPQVMLTERVRPMPLRHLIGHAHRRLAMKANPDGRVMISGGWLGRWDEATSSGQPQPEEVAGNLAEARAVYPILDGAGVSETSADRPETVTFDQIPIVDRVPGIRNALFATGWSGHGWAIAPAVASLIAAWAVSEKRPALLRPFALNRFSGA